MAQLPRSKMWIKVDASYFRIYGNAGLHRVAPLMIVSPTKETILNKILGLLLNRIACV
jgi:hypothetical protein